MSNPICRFCGTGLRITFCDLGMSPPSNSFLTAEQLQRMEPFYPLHAQVCENCFLVQLQTFESPEQIFSDYVYLSSYSDTWLAHMRAYAQDITNRLELGPRTLVIEIASNDGYLLQNFVAAGIPVLGIEPADNVARLALSKGISTLVKFFGVATAQELVGQGKQADLLIGNNVLAHVPDLNDFVAGMKILLARDGTITMEFPHLLRLIEENQFDTIYHEHFSYFSLTTVDKVFRRHGLELYDVEELDTHGGSLRIYAQHAREKGAVAGTVRELLSRENSSGMTQIETYRGFDAKVRECKRRLLAFLLEAKDKGMSIAAYGAAAKGNTLLNYCGVRGDFIDYVVDRNPNKQGRFLPGTHLPVFPPDRIRQTRPDYLLILPWNIRDEVVAQTAYIREWRGRHVVPIPRIEVIE